MAFKGAAGTVSIIDKATQPLRTIAKSFLGLGKASQGANKNLSTTQKAINGLGQAQNRLNRVQSNINRNTKDIGGQAVGIAALGLSFRQALNPAIEFEQSMKDLQAVAFGAADSSVPVAKNMAILAKQAKQLGASTAFSANQAAQGQIFLAKAGFKTNEILNAMNPLLDLAAASGTELGRASDITSDLLGAFGMKANETAKLADVLAASTSSANVDMETLFETLKVVAPIGVAAGQSMQSMVTATSLLGNVGIKGSNAGTALKNALVNLASPAAQGSKILKELGIEVADANGKMLPLQDIMQNLGKSAKDLGQTKQIEAFSGIFGKEAMAGAINLEKAINSGDFAKMLKNLQNSEGVAAKMAKIKMDSTKGSITQLMSAVEGIAITFGSKLAPAIGSMAKSLSGLSEPLQSFLENNSTLIKGVGAFAAVMLAAKVATLGYTATMWLVSPALTAVSTALGIAKGAMILLNLAMKASPIGTLITLGAVAVGIYTNWSKITDTFKELWEVIKAFDFSNITGSLSKIANVFGFGSSGADGADGDDGLLGSISSLFGSSESTPQVQPQLATQAIQANSVNNNSANITVNVADNQVKSVETNGDFKTNVFLNDGVQN